VDCVEPEFCRPEKCNNLVYPCILPLILEYGCDLILQFLSDRIDIWHFHKKWTPSVGGARLTPSRRAKGGAFNLTGQHVC